MGAMSEAKGSLWLAILVCVWAWPLAARPDGAMGAVRIRIPKNMATENLCIGTGEYGQGASIGHIRGQAGVWAYEVPCYTSSTVKLFAYLPGYRIVHITNVVPGAMWSPAFARLEAAEMKGVLTDTKGHPVPGQGLIMEYRMMEAMSFFGYWDGGVPGLVVATAKTRDDGTFEAAIPVLDQDPFLQERAAPMGIQHRKLDLTLASGNRDSGRRLCSARRPCRCKGNMPGPSSFSLCGKPG
jgi:hypothetical protein